jgi:chromosome segregation ATPase
MENEINIERELQSEIEKLRINFSNTQELYSEVCVLLFFRYGITPTANKLYQLVRKGSMSAPAEALGKFWKDLREKSRILIKNPDVPEDLKNAAGEMVGAMWSKAQGLAQESLISLRADADKSINEAEMRLSDAESAKEIAQNALQEARDTIINSEIRVREFEQTLAGEIATRVALEAQLLSVQLERIEQQKEMADARRDFSTELEKLREALKITEERHKAVESRALLEMDRERTIAAKIQKELEKVRSSASEAADKLRTEIHTLQDDIGNQKQRHGNIEGELRAVNILNSRLTAELSLERESVLGLGSQLNAKAIEIDAWKTKAFDAQKELESLRSTKRRTSRKIRGVV